MKCTDIQYFNFKVQTFTIRTSKLQPTLNLPAGRQGFGWQAKYSYAETTEDNSKPETRNPKPF